MTEHPRADDIWEMRAGNKPEMANVAKLCSNFLIVSAIQSIAEGIELARKSDLDVSQWMSMLTQTIFNAPVYINYGNILMKEVYQPPGFSLRLGLKDMNLVLQQASSVNAKMPFGNVVYQQLKDSVANNLGEHDLTAIALALK